MKQLQKLDPVNHNLLAASRGALSWATQTHPRLLFESQSVAVQIVWKNYKLTMSNETRVPVKVVLIKI